LIYHEMARGNARQKIVRDDADRRRLIDGLEQSVVRHGWDLLCYAVMGNHLHLLVKTPRPNLGAGMQSFLSGYAIWAGRRWRRLGHLFQERYRAKMIEDQSNPPVAEARQLSGLDPNRIFAAVASFYGLDDEGLSRCYDPHLARAVAAWLCRRHTEASLRELAASLGLYMMLYGAANQVSQQRSG
jgi:REP element-mobilizing transposase RayT